jgi:hypothetical protein
MTKHKTKVYISGPLTTGNLIDNVRQAAKVAGRLLDEGFAVYLPHVNIFWEMIHAAPYEVWLDNDFAWLDVCDIFLRLPGVSNGADREQQRFIVRNGASRVYLSLETLLACERA